MNDFVDSQPELSFSRHEFCEFLKRSGLGFGALTSMFSCAKCMRMRTRRSFRIFLTPQRGPSWLFMEGGLSPLELGGPETPAQETRRSTASR
ncbi:MAG: hypothetical protein M2R45_03915 [Verrucomicrobia subdivision 3 bacterium]|nr:hypothetical protein [Limisphaerales bacterium]MCS1417504.1 hypothetical protein [Limisphaerales bacterium]